MSVGAVVSFLLGAVVLAFVLAPLFRKDSAQSEFRAAAVSGLADLQSRHEMVLASLNDLEDDRATGKIGDDDYAALERRLTAEAVEVLKEMDALKKRKPGSPILIR